MAFEIKENKFIAFRNIKLKDTHPDYKGEINVEGEQKEIVIWVRKDRNGEQFLSGSINPAKGEKLEP
jgi:hypothetical protein